MAWQQTGNRRKPTADAALLRATWVGAGLRDADRGRFRTVAAIVLLILVALRVLDPATLASVRLNGFDTLIGAMPDEALSDRIAVVAIDDASLAEHGQWPWPRAGMAELTSRLVEQDARAVGFDIVFAEPDRTPDLEGADVDEQTDPAGDRAFAAAMAAVPVIVGVAARQTDLVSTSTVTTRLGFIGEGVPTGLTGYGGFIGNVPAIAAAAAGQGALAIAADRPDGLIRRVPLVVRAGAMIVPHFALEALRVSQGAGSILVESDSVGGVGQISVARQSLATDPDGTIWLPSIDAPQASYYSAADVLAGRLPAGALADRVVLVGLTAAGLGEVSGLADGMRASGLTVMAISTHALLEDSYFTRPGSAPVLEIVAGVVVGLVLTVFLPRMAAGGMLATAGALAVAVVSLSLVFALTAQVLVDASWILLVIVVLMIAALAGALAAQERLRRVHDAAVTAHDDFLRRAADVLFDAVLVCDDQGRILVANRAAEKLLGTAGRAVSWSTLDTTLAELPPPGHDLGKGHRSLLKALLDCDPERGTTSSLSAVACVPVGAASNGIILEARATRYARGNIGYVIVALRDAGARRRAESERDRLRYALQEVMDSIDEGVAVWDEAGHLLWDNQAFRRVAPGLRAVPDPRQVPGEPQGQGRTWAVDAPLVDAISERIEGTVRLTGHRQVRLRHRLLEDGRALTVVRDGEGFPPSGQPPRLMAVPNTLGSTARNRPNGRNDGRH